MQPSDIRRRQQVRVHVEYLYEDVVPEVGKPEPVIGTETSAKLPKWYVDRIFYFTAGSSVACLTVVAAVPNPGVQATACTVWAGSVGLVKFMLGKAQKAKKAKKAT